MALLTDLGVALEKQGKTEEAVTFLSLAARFEEVLRLNPKNETACGALAPAAQRR